MGPKHKSNKTNYKTAYQKPYQAGYHKYETGYPPATPSSTSFARRSPSPVEGSHVLDSSSIASSGHHSPSHRPRASGSGRSLLDRTYIRTESPPLQVNELDGSSGSLNEALLQLTQSAAMQSLLRTSSHPVSPPYMRLNFTVCVWYGQTLMRMYVAEY